MHQHDAVVPLAGHAVEPDVLLGGGEDGLAHNPLELHWLRQHGGLGATAPTLHWVQHATAENP
jgi:hypothetical protein